jgi:hypothetical protein
MKKNVTINVAQQFAPLPFGRYRTDGQYSATRFREEYLVPSLNDYDEVDIILDGLSEAVSSSFLNEAFASLVTKEGFAAETVLTKLHFISERSDLKDEIINYIENTL